MIVVAGSGWKTRRVKHFADMVSGVLAEHLADFSGTPAALAARLIEEY